MGVNEVRLNNREKSSSFLLHSRLVLHLWVVQLCTSCMCCLTGQDAFMIRIISTLSINSAFFWGYSSSGLANNRIHGISISKRTLLHVSDMETESEVT